MPPIQIVGHRGAKGEAPENTLPGFLHARALGLNAVEFDVHLSNDHELVVIHDNTIDRTTNGTGPVANFTAAELAALDARAAFPDWPDIIGVPRLDQVLDIVDDMPLIQIEIKTDTPDRLEEVVAGVLQHVDKRGIGQQALITSFDAVAVEICGRLAPDQARAFIGRPTDPETVDTALRLGRGHVQFHLFRDHAPDQLQRAHDEGLILGGGPCDTIEDLDAAIELGISGVTSDFPSLLLAHLAQTEHERS